MFDRCRINKVRSTEYVVLVWDEITFFVLSPFVCDLYRIMMLGSTSSK